MVLSNRVLQNQTAFLKGQQISDNIGLAQEFLMEYKNIGTSRQACISKAFDILRWDVINKSMELMGIDEVFREMVQACVSSQHL